MARKEKSEMQRQTFIASAVISEIVSSDIYLTVKARILDMKANLNGVRVTQAFIDEIVENEDKYVGIPLCADVKGLISNRTIGHMYDSRTGEFHSTAIGSFYHFEKEDVEGNAYLIGYARIMKRNKAVCKKIGELFAAGSLKFSFEISCGEYEELEDGTMQIDASEKNFLEGAAVVTFPACEEAVALELVAELKGDEKMADVNETEIVAEETVTETAEAAPEETPIKVEAEEVKAEEEKPEEIQAEEVKAEEVKAEEAQEEVTADRIVVETHRIESETQEAYNCDTGENVRQTVTIETHTSSPVESAQTAVAESADDDKSDDDKPEDEDDECEETASCGDDKKRKEEKAEDNHVEETAEAAPAYVTAETYTAAIAAMQAQIDALKEELAELRKPASSEEEIVNPFMAEISAPKKYTLLDSEEKSDKHFTLLDRA
jgi:hypothetical protein